TTLFRSVFANLVAVARDGVHDAVAYGEQLAVVRLEQALLLGDRHPAHVSIEIEYRISLVGRHLGEADRRRYAHGARQLHGAGHHGVEPIQRGEGGDAPTAARGEGAHEAALVLAGGGGFEPPPAETDRGAPGTFDADFSVVGAGALQRRGEPVDQPPSSLSFTA